MGLTFKKTECLRKTHNVKNICIIDDSHYVDSCVSTIKTLLELNKDLRVFVHNYTKSKITQSSLVDEKVIVGERENVEYILRTLDYLISTTKSRLKSFDLQNVNSLKDYRKQNKDSQLERYLYVIIITYELNEKIYKEYVKKVIEYSRINTKDTGIHLMIVSKYINTIPSTIRGICNLTLTRESCTDI